MHIFKSTVVSNLLMQVFGVVEEKEGLDTLAKINESLVDDKGRPFKDIRFVSHSKDCVILFIYLHSISYMWKNCHVFLFDRVGSFILEVHKLHIVT